MNKFEETKKELKEDIKKLEKEVSSLVDGIDEDKKKKVMEVVNKTKNVINSSIEKVSAVINDLSDEEQLNDLLDKIKAKAQEAVDFAINKINTIISDDTKTDIDSLHDDIMNEFDRLKESDIYKQTTVLIKEGYSKINEFLEKPEVKATIKKAKATTIKVAEKGVESLKKVLADKEEPKKAKKSSTKKKATKATATKKKATKAKTTKTNKAA